jgi:hypothetical protein
MRYPSANTLKMIENEQGIALVSALMMGAIGMLMVVSLLFMVGNTGSWTSGSKIRYQAALAASHGGMNFFTQEIIQRGLGGTSLSAMGDYGGLVAPVVSNANLNSKLTTTGRLNDGTYPNAPLDVTMAFAMQTGPAITVNSTILSTSRGNSGTSSNLLLGGGVVNNNSGVITPQHIPYLYQTESRGKAASIENATLSAIYAY